MNSPFFIKLERFICYGFLFLAPLQVRKILAVWNHPGALVFNEWNAAFLYGTDVLLGLLLLGWLMRAHGRIVFSSKQWSATDWALLCFLSTAAASLLVAANLELGLYRLIKLLEFVGLFYYFSRSIERVVNFSQASVVIMASGFFQAVWAIGQAIKQSSLGLIGLGESVLRTNFYGVAVVPFESGRFLRAYGAMPHPNILAAWLLLAMAAFYFWYLYAKQDRPWWSVLAVYTPLLWGFLFTWSRAITILWLVGVGGCFLRGWLNRKRDGFSRVVLKRAVVLATISIVAISIFAIIYWPIVEARWYITGNESAVAERAAYQAIAGEMTRANPWLGVGLGQFVWQIFESPVLYPPYFYQPVHNIYLLISSEVGLLGLAAFGLFIVYLVRPYLLAVKRPSWGPPLFLMVAVLILAMGLSDHFLWTIQQGQIILWLTLAGLNSDFILSKMKA